MCLTLRKKLKSEPGHRIITKLQRQKLKVSIGLKFIRNYAYVKVGKVNGKKRFKLTNSFIKTKVGYLTYAKHIFALE